MGKICKDLFRNFPDFKGIKTVSFLFLNYKVGLETSLTSKGLRQTGMCEDTALFCLETSLTSKGLRPSFVDGIHSYFSLETFLTIKGYT